MSESGSSVIIPALNEESYLPRLLESLAQIKSPLQVIVVDGNSDDQTVAAAEKFIPQFNGNSTLEIVASAQRNISLQRNTGAARARFNTVVFLDADIVIPSAEAYDAMLAEFRKKGYAAASPILTPIERGIRVSLLYAGIHIFQELSLLFGRPYLIGSCLISTKDTFTALGGFNATMRLAEDADYSLRARQVGRCGFLHARISVSARRFLKYGYWWIFKQPSNISTFVFKGYLPPEEVYYPFGEF